MQKEIDALEHNGSRELTKLSSSRCAFSSKWIYRIKYKADGSIEYYKAWLVSRKYTTLKKLALLKPLPQWPKWSQYVLYFPLLLPTTGRYIR